MIDCRPKQTMYSLDRRRAAEYTHVCFVSPRAIRNFCRSAKMGLKFLHPPKTA